MGVSLKYNLSEFNTAIKNINALREEIEDSKDTMITGLEQIRNDWTTDGGIAFFDSIDDDWIKSIQNCLDVLEDLVDSLNRTYSQYDEIAAKAKIYLKM